MISNGRPRVAIACAAEARCSPLKASRLARAAMRRSAFDGIARMTDMRITFRGIAHWLSSPAKAGDRVFQSSRDERKAAAYWMTPLKAAIGIAEGESRR